MTSTNNASEPDETVTLRKYLSKHFATASSNLIMHRKQTRVQVPVAFGLEGQL